MRKMALATGLFVLMISVVFGAAHADPLPLVNNGGGLIYDPNLGITWYDYTYTGPAGNGATWPQAMSWASSLTAGGVSNWTLPTTLPVNGSTYNINIVTVSKGPFSGYFSPSFDGSTDFGFNISAPGSAYPGSKGSEMAYLYYVELGNKGYYDTNGNGPYQADSGLQHTGPFSNLLSREYWSGTEYEPGTFFNVVRMDIFRQGCVQVCKRLTIGGIANIQIQLFLKTIHNRFNSLLIFSKVSGLRPRVSSEKTSLRISGRLSHSRNSFSSFDLMSGTTNS